MGPFPFFRIKYIGISAKPIQMKSHGLIIPTVTQTVRVRNKPYEIKITITQRMKSITITSLENLVTILPIGFESKNKISARRILFVT